MNIKSVMRRYTSNEAGQVAVITAIVALPLLLGVSVAVDSHRIGLERAKLQSALDNAALAAITDQTLTSAERSEHATERFWANMSGEQNVEFSVVESDDQLIEISAEMAVSTLFSGIVGRETVSFKADSAAEITKGRTVCMLALDPDSARSFEVSHGAALAADCSVQVNSRHQSAAVVDHGGVTSAHSFCVAGGATGEYEPFVNTECATLGDPYTHLEMEVTSEPCIDEDELRELMNDWRSERDAVENHVIEEDRRTALARAEGRVWYPTYFEKARLKPGNYCRGLSLSAKEFILEPGEYHIGGSGIYFGWGTELIGEDVTFVLRDKARVEVADGSILNIKAPNTGPYAGLVIAQNIENKSMADPRYPNVESIIRDGSKLDLIGTVYLPSHKIRFLGGSLSKTHAPATAFIAHQISVNDGALISVSADHVSAGSVPIEPRSDDGARLVK